VGVTRVTRRAAALRAAARGGCGGCSGSRARGGGDGDCSSGAFVAAGGEGAGVPGADACEWRRVGWGYSACACARGSSACCPERGAGVAHPNPPSKQHHNRSAPTAPSLTSHWQPPPLCSPPPAARCTYLIYTRARSGYSSARVTLWVTLDYHVTRHQALSLAASYQLLTAAAEQQAVAMQAAAVAGWDGCLPCFRLN